MYINFSCAPLRKEFKTHLILFLREVWVMLKGTYLKWFVSFEGIFIFPKETIFQICIMLC